MTYIWMLASRSTLCVIMVRLMMCFLIAFACILITPFLMVAQMSNPSWLAYSTLRSLCIVHGVDVQNVSRRTLYNWRTSGVCHDHIDLLRLRLTEGGFLSEDAITDIYLSSNYIS